MKDIVYAGNRVIPAEMVDRFRLEIARLIGRSRVLVNDKPVYGQSISYLVSCIRDETAFSKLPSNTSDQESMFQALGFGVSRSANPPKKFTSEFTARKITAVYIK